MIYMLIRKRILCIYVPTYFKICDVYIYDIVYMINNNTLKNIFLYISTDPPQSSFCDDRLVYVDIEELRVHFLL
jgi:cbb3-type cytochrome oxidase subunit 1